MDNNLKTTNNGRPSQHFGEIDITAHYTLGAGLAEQLGDKVGYAVLGALSNPNRPIKRFYFEGAMIRRELFWHCHNEEGIMRPNPALSIHLSNDPDYNEAVSVDWLWF
jgi:hypothetical protein